MATLTDNRVLQIATSELQSRGLTYNEDEGLVTRFVEQGTTQDEAPAYWVVSYVSRADLLEPRDYFMHIRDSTGSVLYILGPHGKLREPVV